MGHFLRKWSLDELPQLWNVVVGEMSLVGPRPVPVSEIGAYGHSNIYGLYSLVRPGITGPATLKYHDEAEILASVDDPEAHNRDVIFPDKVAINRAYVEEWSFRKDLGYLAQTLGSVAGKEPR